MSILDSYPPQNSAFDPGLRGHVYQFNAQYAYTAIRATNIYRVSPSNEHAGYWCASKAGPGDCVELRRPIAHDGLAYYLPEGLTWTKERIGRRTSTHSKLARLVAKEDSVYFIEAVDFHRVKIGHSNHPAKRLAKLSAQSASPLKLVRTICGGEKTERELHKRFAHLRVHGEWFQLDGELSGYIQSIPKGQQ